MTKRFGKICKRLVAGAAALVFAVGGGVPALRDAGVRFDIPVFAADIVESGYCGDPDVNDGKNVSWTLDSEGTLTISGTGDMANYTSRFDDPDSAPWLWLRVNGNIKKVIIYDGVTGIGEFCFYYCHNLTDVAIPNSVSKIKHGAFCECSALEELYIPYSVISIDDYFFAQHCNVITNFNVDNNNPVYSSVDGILFNKDKTEILCCPSGKHTATIPNSVTIIGDGAFECCEYLTDIIIPGSVKSIGDSAFWHCDELKNIIIPYGVTSIGADAFGYCGKLTDLTIPESVESIGSSAFYCCESLKKVNIPNNITRIDDDTFRYCTSLSKITIPNSVTSIGDYAFQMSGLTEINIPESVSSIGSYAFACENLKEVLIPDTVKTIGWRAFGYTENYHTVPDFKILCTHNSAAEKYAIEYNFAYEYIDSLPDYSELKEYSFDFLAEDLEKEEINYSDTFYYTDKYFENSSYEYNPSLATASLALAMSSFRAASGSEEPNYTKQVQTKNARAFMKSIGIKEEDIYANDDFGKEPEMNSMGVIIGSKPLGDSTLIVVGLRGAGYSHEWGGNFNVGEDGYHTGFAMCRDEVKRSLEEYVKDYGVSGKAKLWIAGYSRAAATANLTAGWLMRNDIKGITLEPKDIYAYCFETPMGAPEKEPGYNASVRGSYFNNIFNIINPNDFVPMVAPADMGFTRYGRDIILPSISNCDPKQYKKAKECMLKYYHTDIKGKYVIDDFSGIVGKLTQDAFFDYFINEVSKNVLKSSRKNFSDNYQEAVMNAMSELYPNFDAFKMELKKELMIYAGASLVVSPWLVATVASLDTKGILQRAMKAADMEPLTNKDMNALADLLKKVLLHNNVSLLLLLENDVKGAHYPELCWAWVKAMDPNSEDHFDYRLAYDKKKTSYSICNINCAVDVNVYDSEDTLVASIIGEEPQDIEVGLCCYIDENGQKTVILPGNGEYRIEVTAREDDTVNIQMLDYDQSAGDYSRNVNYFDVPMKNGAKLNASVSAQPADETDREIVVKTDKDEIVATDSVLTGEQVTDNQHTVTLIANEDEGTVIGSGTYEYGSFAAIYAVPNDGYIFEGWYDGDTKVELDEDGRLCVKTDIALTARFSVSEVNCEINVSPKFDSKESKTYTDITLTVDGKTFTADSTGKITITGLADGTYEAVISKPNYAPVNVTITVGGENADVEIYKYGDADKNGKVDQSDLALLQKYSAGWNVTVDKPIADVTLDGKVNGEDIALMQKYFAGWNVTLGQAS